MRTKLSRSRWIPLGLSLLFAFASFGQDSAPAVQFRAGFKTFERNIERFVNNPDVSPDEIFDQFYIRYIQFEQIPSLEDQEELKQAGLQILEYVPKNTYLVALPSSFDPVILVEKGARSVVRPAVEDKMDNRFHLQEIPDWAWSGDNIRVIIKAYSGINQASFISLLRANGISPSKEQVQFPIVLTTLPKADIDRVASLSFVQYVEIGPAPAIPEDTGGRTLQRANLINNLVDGGLRFNGDGVRVMVRDDGAVGPHIDFEGRIVDFTGGSQAGTHGDGVAGVMAGAGNLDPTVEGGASGATIYVLNYNSTFTDNTVALHQSDNVVITNSSYSDGCNAGYTTTTQRVDQQMIDNPSLIHVFSGGNSNGNNCGYGAGTQWGNVTGGHKVGKNVMATANVFADGGLVSHSSRGPAHDGRIKPDITAHGQNQISTNPNNGYQTFGGTSAAAPTMAGSMTQLYEVYRSMNGGMDPEAGLIKAIVLNTAFDMGNTGPDFKFGWGRIDAYQAYQVLDMDYHTTGTVSQGNSNMHTVTVPANVAEARIMVYWTDPAAAVNTNKALVNDLDLTVDDPGMTNHLPWVLNHFPHADSLDMPAKKGVDTLNNMEQVAIVAPTAGEYTVHINGSSIPMGSQEYYIIWTFLYDDIMVTYPYGGEGFVPGESERIHWDAYGTTGTFDVEYSTDDGGSWNNISTGLSGDTRLVSWIVPNNVTEEALVRVSRNGQSDVSDENFSIIGLPSNLSVSDICMGGVNLTWNAVTGADEYVVYVLGEKYMEVQGQTSDTQFDITGLEIDEEAWFAVQAINDDGVRGRRSDAVSHTPPSTADNCPNTISFEKLSNASSFLAGDTIMYSLKLTSYYTTDITGVVISDTLAPNVTYVEGSLTCGTENAGVITINPGNIAPGDSVVCSFKVKTSVDHATEVLFLDDVEAGMDNWTTENGQGTAVWSISMTNPNSPVNSWFTPNTGTENNTQYLISDEIALTAGSELSFYHHYQTEAGWDGGIIEISTDNGTNWSDLGPMITQNGYSGVLGTNDNFDINGRSAFTGNSQGYLQTLVDLSSFGNQSVRLRFLFGEDDNTADIGWYVDDIKIAVPYFESNMACADFDQGDKTCDSVSSEILECLVDCDPCADGVQNGNETGVDCGGGTCPICPCTQVNPNLVIKNVTIPDGTDAKIEIDIMTMGTVLTPDASNVVLQAGNEIGIESDFTVGNAASLTLRIEDCATTSFRPEVEIIRKRK